MLYDEFTDTASCPSELEMRLSHIQPAEILHQPDLPKGVLQVLEDWKKHRSAVQTEMSIDIRTGIEQGRENFTQ